MPSFWGPSDEELMNARSYHFSENFNISPSASNDDDESNESEVEGDEDMGDDFVHLFDLAEAAHLVEVYHTDENILPSLEDITLHSTHSPRKCSHL